MSVGICYRIRRVNKKTEKKKKKKVWGGIPSGSVTIWGGGALAINGVYSPQC